MIDDTTLKNILAPHLGEDGALEAAFADPDADLVELGLDSLSSFALIDDLQEHGVTVEFTELISTPTLNFLREASERA
ncbi:MULTISPECIES: phosphopantetheine-binding protein [Micrococcales]|uniref:phosphopantetheine-binding protein n=1 Tax=Micrococcales TaxID=85006 RepID=UPI0004AB616A|nr:MULTISPECIES: phosphopantetheine-binding protein [Micrococcales]